MTVRACLLLLALAGPASGAEGEAGRIVFQDITVRQGDTLATIAQTYLKDPTRWDEILKHNRMPSRDPFVALPGMVIKVPVRLIKENLRAGKLVFRLNDVLFRKNETAAWNGAKDNMELFRDDWLRTGQESKARVQFNTDDLIVLDANSMVRIKPSNQDYDLELKGGGAFQGGNARIVTPSAKITPKTKDAKYSVQVNDRMDTRFKVYEGETTVESEGKKVDVAAGQGVEIRLGEAPSAPVPMANLPDFPGRSADFEGALASLRKAKMTVALPQAGGLPAVRSAGAGLGALKKELDGIRVGEAISGYRIQAASDRSFTRMAVNRVFETGAKVDLGSQLAPGRYWVRFKVIDLLGGEGKPTTPKLFDWHPRSGFTPAAGGASSGAGDPSGMVSLAKPSADETVSAASYRASGKVKADDLTVTINGVAARVDESGNFSGTINLRPGPNQVKIVVTGSTGASSTIIRTVTYSP